MFENKLTIINKIVMMTITERLQKFMNYKKLNANKVTVEANLSIGLIGRAIKNNSGINSETIEKILSTYTELNSEWFILENGEMLKTHNQVINNCGSGNNVSSNINGNIGGDVTTSNSELSNLIELQKELKDAQKEWNERLKTTQDQLTESLKQITMLLELIKK